MSTAENALLEAAHQCFLNKGIKKTTMNEIAEEAGLTRRTVYHHFKNKDDILLAIIMKSHHAFIESLLCEHSYQGSFRECVVEVFMFSVKVANNEDAAKYFYEEDIQAKVNRFHLTMPFFAENVAEALDSIYQVKLKQGDANEGENLLLLAELHNRLIVSFMSSPSPFYQTDDEIKAFAERVFL